MVGIAQLVSAPDCGSGGQGFESLYPPCLQDGRGGFVHAMNVVSSGVSPSGKAQDFDSCIRWFESSYPSFLQISCKLHSNIMNMEH